MTIKFSISRRRLLQSAALLPSATIAGCASSQSKDDEGILQADEPLARTLAYYPNSRDVPADHPLADTHKPEQTCSTCVHIRGEDGNRLRECPTFPRRLVNAQGWCSLWAKG